MSKDKYPCIFSGQMEAIVYILSIMINYVVTVLTLKRRVKEEKKNREIYLHFTYTPILPSSQNREILYSRKMVLDFSRNLILAKVSENKVRSMIKLHFLPLVKGWGGLRK